MDLKDREYLQRRADAALRLAKAAKHSAAAKAHYMMASQYLTLLKGEDTRPDAISVANGPSPLRNALGAETASPIAAGMATALRSVEDDAAQQKTALLFERLAGIVRDPALSARMNGMAAEFSDE